MEDRPDQKARNHRAGDLRAAVPPCPPFLAQQPILHIGELPSHPLPRFCPRPHASALGARSSVCSKSRAMLFAGQSRLRFRTDRQAERSRSSS